MTPAQKKLVALGWSIAHTQPLHQSFHFERFISGRRVAAIILRAKTTAGAWRTLGKMVTAANPDGEPAP